MLTLFVPKEVRDFEKRVALIPDDVKKLLKKFRVLIEKKAGEQAFFADLDYQKAGAELVDLRAGLEQADIVAFIQGPSSLSSWQLKQKTTLIGLMAPHQQQSWFDTKQKLHLTSYALELIPRISKAQTMDVLSSQSNLAGYKSVLLACEYFARVLPMMMTAAGTLHPARVLVIGAGVAGLQAIATAKRLGAIVTAFDVRQAAKEQVQSLGATFIEVSAEENLEQTSGYAKDVSATYQERQQQALAQELKRTDIVITTALIPGKPAPKLLPTGLIELLKPGSVVVDLAIAMGGNCELSHYGKRYYHKGIMMIGEPNLPSLIPHDSSKMYSRNMFHFLEHVYADLSNITRDEITNACLLFEDGLALTAQK